ADGGRGQRRHVDRPVVAVGSGIPEGHRIRLVGPAHDDAVPEDLRGHAGRLDGVRARGVPGPRDALARRDRVHGGVLAAVVRTPEEDVPHRDLADRARAASPAPPPPPPPPPPPARAARPGPAATPTTAGQPYPASALLAQ